MLAGALVMWVLLATRGPRKQQLRVWSVVGVAAALVALSFAFFVVSPL